MKYSPKKFLSGVLLLCSMVLVANPIIAYAKSKWPEPVFDNRAWKLAWSENRDGNRFEEYTLKQETVENWSELVTMQFFRGKYNALQFAQKMQQLLKKDCPNADFSILSNKNDPNSIIWTFQAANCSHQKNQLEIARAVVIPNVGIHVFHYATTNLKLSDKDYQAWLVNLFKIKVKN